MDQSEPDCALIMRNPPGALSNGLTRSFSYIPPIAPTWTRCSASKTTASIQCETGNFIILIILFILKVQKITNHRHSPPTEIKERLPVTWEPNLQQFTEVGSTFDVFYRGGFISKSS